MPDYPRLVIELKAAYQDLRRAVKRFEHAKQLNSQAKIRSARVELDRCIAHVQSITYQL